MLGPCAFQWCRLLVLVLRFSPRKYGVFSEKVGKMAFFGCSEIKKSKFTCILLLELKRYWSKVKVFWNAGTVSFQMVWHGFVNFTNSHAISDVWCVMRDMWQFRVDFCQMLSLWVKGRPTMLLMGSLKAVYWLSVMIVEQPRLIG